MRLKSRLAEEQDKVKKNTVQQQKNGKLALTDFIAQELTL